MTCPSCQTKLTPDTRLCPNCGALTYKGQAQKTNAQSDGLTPLSYTSSPYVTRSRGSDIVLAMGITVFSMFGGFGIVAGPILFFVLYKKYPVFAKTVGITWLVTLLGFLALCTGVIGRH